MLIVVVSKAAIKCSLNAHSFGDVSLHSISILQKCQDLGDTSETVHKHHQILDNRIPFGYTVNTITGPSNDYLHQNQQHRRRKCAITR